MIKCDNGGTRIRGSLLETIQDFTNIINAVQSVLEDDLSEEAAAEIITQCGRLSYATRKMDKAAEAEAFEGITTLLLKHGKM